MPDDSIWLGVIVAAITLTYVSAERDFVCMASEGTVLGASILVAAYVLVLLRVRVVTINYIFAVAPGSDELYHRLGIGRGDCNVTAIAAAVFAVGLLGWWLAYSRRGTLSTLVTGSLLVLTSALMMDTYCRSGIYALIIAPALVAVLARVSRLSFRVDAAALGVFVLVVGGFLVVKRTTILDHAAAYWQQIELRDKLNDLLNANNGVGGGFLAGRMDAWSAHLRLISEYPIMGVPRGTFVQFAAGYGDCIVGEAGTWEVAHNSVLEMGSRCGVPGALLFLYFLLWIPYQVLRKKLRTSQIPALAMYSIFLFLFMAFSIGGDKSFWVCTAILFASIKMPRAPFSLAYLYSVREGVGRYIPVTRRYIPSGFTAAYAHSHNHHVHSLRPSKS